MKAFLLSPPVVIITIFRQYVLAPLTSCMQESTLSGYSTLFWRHNEHDGVSNHQPHDCLLDRLFKPRLKKKSKPRVTGLCAGHPPVTGEFPAQRASDPENVSIWWRHHADLQACCWPFIEVKVVWICGMDELLFIGYKSHGIVSFMTCQVYSFFRKIGQLIHDVRISALVNAFHCFLGCKRIQAIMPMII